MFSLIFNKFILNKAILDDRMIDLPLHPILWKLVLNRVKNLYILYIMIISLLNYYIF
jgi:hypothetical protein